jgi:L-2-hydroxyglutarate oxidase
MREKTYGVVIIGGGILGSTLAYWLSSRYEGSIAVLEKEQGIAPHASSHNSGVIHRPFYLHPEKRKLFAWAAQRSYALWKTYAEAKQLPWNEVGTIEVSTDDAGKEKLREYYTWALKNGMREEEIALLSPQEVHALEPQVSCTGGFLAKTDTSVDFGAFTKSVAKDAQSFGVDLLLGYKVDSMTIEKENVLLRCDDNTVLRARFLINCAGGNALRVAHLFGVARNFTDLNFRGEYWMLNPQHAYLANRNIYSVPQHSDFPFLDPHWIRGHDNRVFIGPNAVPVIGPYTYQGFTPTLTAVAKKFFEPPRVNKFKLLTNREFLSLALQEWRSSLSKEHMARRLQYIIPSFNSSMLQGRGAAGVRSTVINAEGAMVKEALTFEGPRSYHVINYNSPGATGAPAYTAHILRTLEKNGALEHLKQRTHTLSPLWDFDATLEGFAS